MTSISPAPPDDSSRLDYDQENDSTLDHMSLPVDQQRYLMEIESSFYVETDAAGPVTRQRSGDLRRERSGEMKRQRSRELGRQRSGEKVNGQRSGEVGLPPLPVHEEESEGDITAPIGHDSNVTASTARQGSRDRSDSIAAIVGDETSSPTEEDIKNLETFTSSPTALAHVRNISRAATASENLNEMFRAQEEVEGGSIRTISPRPSEIGLALERQPSIASVVSVGSSHNGASREPRPSSAATNLRSQSARPLTTKLSGSNINSTSSSRSDTTATASRQRRSKFLRSRDQSQRSSISSVSDMQGQDDDGSTVTAGDGDRQALSRQTSLGSIASGVTALGSGSVYGGERGNANTSAADRALARLDEEERNSRRGSVAEVDTKEKDKDTKEKAATDDDPKNRPVTPKERAIPLAQPTDTVITAHVKNVRVPPTVQRRFSSQHLGAAPNSPSKKAVAAAGTPATTARAREMTLKEQTASIDRLQKENFDLKIKVYYLNEKLEKQSDEGVKEALQENVDMKVKLAEGMRERKALKKRIRELERKVEELGGEKQREEEASAAAESEEIWELRERIEKYEVEIEGYRRRDTEKTERMREFRRQTTNGHQANEELLEQMRDLLNSETARREAADAENLRLRDEVYRMRAHDHATPLSRATSRSERSQSRSGGADNAAVTQLSQVRRENEDLRREVTAQTSMLTSRNREKERLYAEIEDLKICMRNGGQAPAFESASRAPSVFSERLAERSGSRSGGVASSASTHVSTVTESEREDFENTNGALRDRISELRLKNQDLEQQIEEVFQELEHRREELDATGEELDMANAELQEMQNERDEALQQREEIELDFDQLKEEAEEELRRLEDEVDLRGNEILRLEDEIRIKEEDFSAMQRELRNVSDSVVRFEDAQEIHQGEIRRYEERIQDLERTIHENEQEMNVLENTLRENNEKIERLTVQGESAKGEIAFLREEQDGDKILIGELQSKIKQLDAAIEDERDKVRDARAQIDSERNQREQHGDLRQQEWERRLNEKSQELTATKDEIRRLKSKVCNREDEAKTWRERLEDLERGLREALGDLGGTRAGLMQSVLNLQNDLDATLEDLDQARNELTEKDRNLKDRENLLESMALESRKLTDLLEKERSQRGRDKNALEVLQSTTTQDSRRISQHQRQTEVLEKQRQKEAKSLKHLEDQFKEQIAERNNLLLQVWQRLSAVCGADWSSRNSHVITPSPSGVDDGKLSMDTAIISAFPGFTRNLMIAVKTIESIVAGFKTKCRGVERDLWKEYQVVENAVEQRTRRIERLEGLIRNGMGEGSEKIRTELAKLRTENRMLKAEVGTLKTENTAHSATNPSIAISPPTKRDRSSRTHTHSHTSTSHSAAPAEHKEKATEKAPEKDSLKEPSKQRSSSSSSSQKDKPLAVVRTDTPPTATATSKSTSSTSTSNPAATTTGATGSSTAEGGSGGSGSGSGAGGEKRWILRLRELEKRLKQEREARLLDRSMANKKIQETRGEREEMRRELERERVRGNSAMSGRSS